MIHKGWQNKIKRKCQSKQLGIFSEGFREEMADVLGLEDQWDLACWTLTLPPAPFGKALSSLAAVMDKKISQAANYHTEANPYPFSKATTGVSPATTYIFSPTDLHDAPAEVTALDSYDL